MKIWKLKFSSLRIILNTAFLNMIFFNRHPNFPLILELFPLHISLCGSYLEASKPSFLVRPKQYIYFHLAFLQTHFFGHYGFIFFRDEPVAHLCSLGAFSLLSLAPSSSACDLCHHTKQVLLTLHSQSALREVSPSICLIFSSTQLPAGWFFLFLLLQQSCIILLT